jgi:small subunit ribosomal protein S2
VVVRQHEADCKARAEDTNHLKKRGSTLESTTERVGIRDLLEAGVHFGHQAKRWNPKMKRYIFAERAGVHIIDLDQTLTLLDRALDFVRGVAEAERGVLFVGTKKQAQIPIAEQAIRSGQPFIAERYIGGILTNFQTILPRIQYFKDLARTVEETPEEERSGKDWFALTREYQKLRRNFAGITEMERLPGAVFVIDPKREELLVKEANRLKIPVIALTDTNCDPEVVDYVIPGNDDAIRAISLISRLVADAIVEGRGEEALPTESRPVPPVVEEARVSEDAAGDAAPEDAAPTADGRPQETPSEEVVSAGEVGRVEEAPDEVTDTQEEEPQEEEPQEEEPQEEEPQEEEPQEEEPQEEEPQEEEPQEEEPQEAEADDTEDSEDADLEPASESEGGDAEASESGAGGSEAAEPEAVEPQEGEGAQVDEANEETEEK